MINKKYLAISLCCFAGQLFAQIVNTGDVFISSYTQIGMEEDFINLRRSTVINEGEWFVYKDFENNSVIDFETDTQAVTKFVGDSIQVISGQSWSIFNDILFNNSSQDTAFYLKGLIDVYGQSIFEDGIILNDDYGGNFLFEDEAEVVNVSDESHIDGQVKKVGQSDFWYPIGDAGMYRPGGHAIALNDGSQLAAKYWYQNSDELFNHENKEENIVIINDKEYWTVENISNQEENVLITLSWDSRTTPKELITEPEALHIVYWSEEEQSWLDKGGLIDYENRTITTVAKVKELGVFTFASLTKVAKVGELVVNTGFSPNNDNVNEYWSIENIDQYPENEVLIYNRWGHEVFSTERYNTTDNFFNGYSNRNKRLPSGTYFYVLEYKNEKKDSKGEVLIQTGYFYMNTD